MATTIQNIEILRAYLSGVLDRANHHAQKVNEIALAIAGGIIWRTTDNIKVMSREGEMKNVLWLQVGTPLDLAQNYIAQAPDMATKKRYQAIVKLLESATKSMLRKG